MGEKKVRTVKTSQLGVRRIWGKKRKCREKPADQSVKEKKMELKKKKKHAKGGH